MPASLTRDTYHRPAAAVGAAVMCTNQPPPWVLVGVAVVWASLQPIRDVRCVSLLPQGLRVLEAHL